MEEASLENKNNSILVALNDSVSSRAVVDFLASMSLCPEDWDISLLHFFRKPSSSEVLMGKKFAADQPARLMGLLEKAKEKLVEGGFFPEKIHIELVNEQYETIADGIIDQANKRQSSMVIIGRKKMSKAEEFVMGDISVKVIRA
ncbi:MAG: universal stress protein, partial [Deltaproteobacteria bacterium]|nr:universal stress protein [Deltaproteobacteria bacterium]